MNGWISEKMNFNNCIICQNLKNHIIFIKKKTNKNKINKYLEETCVPQKLVATLSEVKQIGAPFLRSVLSWEEGK